MSEENRSLDNSEIAQATAINKKLNFEENLEDFNKNLAKMGWHERHKFFNACFFLIGSEELKSLYCESIKYVLLFTTVESIMGKKDYVDFYEWLRAKNDVFGIEERDKLMLNIISDNFQKKIFELFEVYRKNYGIVEHVREFFRNYIDIEDKKQIILAFNEHKEGEIFAPKCYLSKKDCFEYEGVQYESFLCKKKDNKNCILFKSEEEINQGLNKTISALYDIFRNTIIHEGNRSHFLDSFKMPDAICAGNSLSLLHRKNKKEKHVIIEDGLNINRFREIIHKGIKNYYNQEIKNKE
jgi:hypothetical protein